MTKKQYFLPFFISLNDPIKYYKKDPKKKKKKGKKAADPQGCQEKNQRSVDPDIGPEDLPVLEVGRAP